MCGESAAGDESAVIAVIGCSHCSGSLHQMTCLTVMQYISRLLGTFAIVASSARNARLFMLAATWTAADVSPMEWVAMETP